jgi:hypothetical protein
MDCAVYSWPRSAQARSVGMPLVRSGHADRDSDARCWAGSERPAIRTAGASIHRAVQRAGGDDPRTPPAPAVLLSAGDLRRQRRLIGTADGGAYDRCRRHGAERLQPSRTGGTTNSSTDAREGIAFAPFFPLGGFTPVGCWSSGCWMLGCGCWPCIASLPLADAFAHTFGWPVASSALAAVPAVVLPSRHEWRRVPARGRAASRRRRELLARVDASLPSSGGCLDQLDELGVGRRSGISSATYKTRASAGLRWSDRWRPRNERSPTGSAGPGRASPTVTVRNSEPISLADPYVRTRGLAGS